MITIRPFISPSAKLCAMAAAALSFAGMAHAASAISGQGTWETTLKPRYFTTDHSKGADAYFDTTLNITWLTNTTYPFNDPGTGGSKWSTAVSRASLLGVAGTTGWRLPSADANEFTSLYSLTLGNDAAKIQAGNLLLNTGPFKNVLPVDRYWMKESTPMVDGWQSAWQFDFTSGTQHLGVTFMDGAAWFVHSGDVFAASSVPEPSALSMVLAALALGGGMQVLHRYRGNRA